MKSLTHQLAEVDLTNPQDVRGGTLAEPRRYRLIVQHQPALNSDLLEIEVVVPDGAVLASGFWLRPL